MDITPSDLFDKRAIPAASQPAEDPDYLGTIERILDKADGLLTKVAMSRGVSLNGSAPSPSGGGLTLSDIKTALETVKSVKGDIPISELMELLAQNAGAIEGVLGK